jgi:hypothetical protein
LISDYELELDSPPCKPGAATWSARTSLDRKIADVLFYLNSILEDADYDHDAKILIWKKGDTELSCCPVLVQPAYGENHRRLLKMLEAIGQTPGHQA